MLLSTLSAEPPRRTHRGWRPWSNQPNCRGGGFPPVSPCGTRRMSPGTSASKCLGTNVVPCPVQVTSVNASSVIHLNQEKRKYQQ